MALNMNQSPGGTDEVDIIDDSNLFLVGRVSRIGRNVRLNKKFFYNFNLECARK